MPLSYRDTSQPLIEPVTLAEAKAQAAVDAAMTLDDALITSLIVAARQYVERLINRPIFNRTMKLWLDFFPYYAYASTGFGAWNYLAIRLPKPRALSVESVTYTDRNFQTQTVAPSQYWLDAKAEPARVVPLPGLYWPTDYAWVPNSICVSYTAGNYVDVFTENLTVKNHPGSPPTITEVQVTNALYTGMISLVNAQGNAVPYTPDPTDATVLVLNVPVGQVLTATYYIGACPQAIKQAILLLVAYWYEHRDAAETQPPQAIAHGIEAILASEVFETFGL